MQEPWRVGFLIWCTAVKSGSLQERRRREGHRSPRVLARYLLLHQFLLPTSKPLQDIITGAGRPMGDKIS